MKNETIVLVLLPILILSIITSSGFSFSDNNKKENRIIPIKQKKQSDETEKEKQKAIELVKCVYEIRGNIYISKDIGACTINNKKCYEIYACSNNKYTTTTMEIFGVDTKSNRIYCLNRISGEYEKIAEVKYKDLIDKYLNIIMSSPKESSNTNDYIKRHKKEYNAIVALGSDALLYLKSIWDNGDRGLRGNLALILCRDIKPSLNIGASTSPNGSLLIETYGIDNNVAAGGLYASKGIRLIEKSTGKALWGMTPGYYVTKFIWSKDSRYVAIYYEARIYGESVIFDTKDKKVIKLPGIEEIQIKLKNKLKVKNDRFDPYIKITEWLSNEKIKVEFNCSGNNDDYISGAYVFDVVTNEMSNLKYSVAPRG